MNSTESRLKQLDNPALTIHERVLLRCRLASEFIHTGQYEIARETLGDLWQGIGERPNVEKLKPLLAAEVLLQCGTLSSWLGKVRRGSGAQERAKDLLSEAFRMFKSQSQYAKASETQYELGMCYFWLGSYDAARIVLDEALTSLGESDNELRAKILIRQTIVEIWTNRYHDALKILEEARGFFEAGSDALKGRWHGQMALVLRRLASAEERAEYIDRAIIEYTAAIIYYEQAKHERYCATNINNLAYLLYKLGRYEEAHEHLDRAVKILARLKDDGLLAQVNETRARVLVAEQKYEEANRIISDAVQVFEKGNEYALLADALTVQGVAKARLEQHEGSVYILRRAVNVAQDSGALSNAGLAALTLIEEHGTSRLSQMELYRTYQRADELLKDTQDVEHVARLRACARIMGRRLLGAQLSDKGFSLQRAIREFEARYIEEALELEQGSVSRAAKRLGMTHQVL